MKEQEFIELRNKVKKCRICENIFFSPHLENSDRLVCGKDAPDGLWNNPKDLDAEYMVIGQDYGSLETEEFPTDKTLKALFAESKFKIEDVENSSKVFFTNIVNCYRCNKSTGEINKGCLSVCAREFMSELIRIISPRAIIVLGKEPFFAMNFCRDAKIVCTNKSTEKLNNNLSKIMKYEYVLEFDDGLKIPIYPVYHPGANGRRTRNEDDQKSDWSKIKEKIEKYHGKEK